MRKKLIFPGKKNWQHQNSAARVSELDFDLKFKWVYWRKFSDVPEIECISFNPTTDLIFFKEKNWQYQPFLSWGWHSLMGLPSSLLQAICVLGLPRALHTRPTGMPSVAKVSELDSSSMMSGGTEAKIKWKVRESLQRVSLRFELYDA